MADTYKCHTHLVKADRQADGSLHARLPLSHVSGTDVFSRLHQTCKIIERASTNNVNLIPLDVGHERLDQFPIQARRRKTKLFTVTSSKGKSSTSQLKTAKTKSGAQPIEPSCDPPALSDYDKLAADLERVMEIGAVTDDDILILMKGLNESVDDPDCRDGVGTVDDDLVGFRDNEHAMVRAALETGDVSADQVQQAANSCDPDMLPDHAFDDAALSVMSNLNRASALDYNVAAEVWRITFERGINALEHRRSKMALNIGSELALLARDSAPHPHNVFFVHFHHPDTMFGRKVRIDEDQGAVFPMNTVKADHFHDATVVVPAVGIQISKHSEIKKTKRQREEMRLLQMRPRVPDVIMDLQKMWSTAIAIGQGHELHVLDKTCAVCGGPGEHSKLVVCSMCRQTMHPDCCQAVMAIRAAPHPIDIDLPDIFGRSPHINFMSVAPYVTCQGAGKISTSRLALK